MKVRTGLLFASSAALLTMTGCVDQDRNLFDAEATAALYASAFPVDNIDPDMDWTTTRSASLSVAVEEDAGVDYTVRVFTDDPLAENTTAKLLAEGVARKGQPFTAKIDVPSALDGVYITRTDEHNRHLLKYVSVSNNAVATTFGAGAVGSSVKSLAQTRSEAITAPDYTPSKSESDIKALIAGATELTASVKPVAGGVYYIPAGKTVGTGESWMGSSNARVTIIVAGTCQATKKVEDNVDIYVIGGGKYEIPSGETLEISNSSTFTLYAGGKLSGGNINFSNGGTCYFAGDVDVDTFTIPNGDVYNYGTFKVNYANFCPATLSNHGKLNIAKTVNNIIVYNDGTFDGTTFEGVLYNVNGKSTIENFYNYNNIVINLDEFYATKTFHGSITNYGKATITGVYTGNKNTIINNCNLTCYGDFRGDIYGKSNSITTVTGDFTSEYNSLINLEANAMVDIQGTSNWNGDGIVGPNDGYGLIRTAHLTSASYINGNTGLKGNIHFEIEKCDITGSNLTDWHAWLLNTNGTISKKGESPLIITDCTGATNTPVPEGDTDLGKIPQISYTYAFEDNYPKAGDYDFNDVVLGVTVKNNQDATTGVVESVDVEVALKAVGATNTVGAGLRLYGIDKSKVGDVTLSGDDASAFTTTLSGSQFEDAIKEDAGNNKYVVIPLFGDAHKVLGVNGHIITNTYAGATTVAAKTLKINIKTNEEISLENLDFFITNGSTSDKGRTEIHLYNFLVKNGSVNPDAATSMGSIEPNNAEVLANHGYTWAIYAPDFRYPKETVKITEAYPYFANWAQHHNNSAWYNNPESDKIY